MHIMFIKKFIISGAGVEIKILNAKEYRLTMVERNIYEICFEGKTTKIRKRG